MKQKQLNPLYSLALITLFFAALANHDLQGQGCEIDYDLTLDPPIPSSGAYLAGTTVQFCYTINSLSFQGANWLSGIGFEFPEGWDESSIINLDTPEACSFGGTWIFFDSLNCNGVELPPGFYFDDNAGGPQDGNPCNNWGDPCSGNWQFCIEATLDAYCGGTDNPLDGEAVTPGLAIFGDGDIGSWIINTTCFLDSTNVYLPDDVDFEVNCCDGNPGEDSGIVPICENGSICLIDQLLGIPEPGGAWTGPTGWEWLGTDCAEFDPVNDPPGEYVYTVLGTNGCLSSASVIMGYADLGIVQSVAYCDLTPTCLTDLVTNVSLPDGGNWFYPDGSPVTGCTIDPTADPEGEYTYEYSDESSCYSVATLSLIFSPAANSGCFTTYDYCSDTNNICPIELLDCDPSSGGQWILFDSNDNFGAFYPNSDLCLSNNEIANAIPGNIEDGIYFIYVLGAAPCNPSFDTLQVNVYDYFDAGEPTQTALCLDNGSVDLLSLLNGTPDPGGVFTNALTGEILTNPLNISEFNEGDVLQLVYSGGGFNENSCYAENPLRIIFHEGIIDAGPSRTIELCGDSSVISLNDLLHPSASPGGIWSPEDSIALTPLNSGTYTYTTNAMGGCLPDQANYTINILEQLSVSNINATCTEFGFYTVSFDISGGDGNYSVVPMSGSFTGSTFTSEPIMVGTPYNFTVSDTGPCSDIGIIGPAPDCDCPVTANIATQDTTLCAGECLDLVIELEGNPPFNIEIDEGNDVSSINGISPPYFLSVCPVETTSYSLVSVSDANCIGQVAGDSVTVSILHTDAGLNHALTVCESDPAFNLFDSIPLSTNGPQLGGQWFDPLGSPLLDGFFVPGQSTPGTYQYIVNNACGSDIAMISISVEVDSDSDGICDSAEIVGCQNPNASNFNPLATDPGYCVFISSEPIFTAPTPEEIGPTKEYIERFNNDSGRPVGHEISNSNSGDWNISAFPNPIGDNGFNLYISEIPATSLHLSVSISSIRGRLIASSDYPIESGSSSLLIPFDSSLDISKGTYILHVKIGDDVKYLRLIK